LFKNAVHAGLSHAKPRKMKKTQPTVVQYCTLGFDTTDDSIPASEVLKELTDLTQLLVFICHATQDFFFELFRLPILGRTQKDTQRHYRGAFLFAAGNHLLVKSFSQYIYYQKR